MAEVAEQGGVGGDGAGGGGVQKRCGTEEFF